MLTFVRPENYLNEGYKGKSIPPNSIVSNESDPSSRARAVETAARPTGFKNFSRIPLTAFTARGPTFAASLVALPLGAF